MRGGQKVEKMGGKRQEEASGEEHLSSSGGVIGASDCWGNACVWLGPRSLSLPVWLAPPFDSFDCCIIIIVDPC